MYQLFFDPVVIFTGFRNKMLFGLARMTAN
jgi:hypothetical protein